MLDPEDQAEVLDRIARVARRHNLLVAPVGSVYFLYHGQPRLRTVDVDTVVFDASGEPASIETLEAFGRELGEAEVRFDGASVLVRPPDGEVLGYEIDLLRGKSKPRAGFFPRPLLREAAKRGQVQDNLLWFPREYVIVLKADAAVDRKQRAEEANEFQADNAERAVIFQQDVFAQVREALTTPAGLSEVYIREAVKHLKEKRRTPVLQLIEAASLGQLRLT